MNVNVNKAASICLLVGLPGCGGAHDYSNDLCDGAHDYFIIDFLPLKFFSLKGPKSQKKVRFFP